MSETDLEPRPEGEGRRIFATTHWSQVLAAGANDSPPARRALEALCQAYWYPIYVYVRRKGHAPDNAQDLTQEFFAQIIAKEHLRLADRTKGRFRTFLLAMLDQYLLNERSKARRQKRGGQFQFVSLDEPPPEERYRLEPVDHQTPERKFLKQWAVTVLKNTLGALETECGASGKGPLFSAVRACLSEDPEDGTYAEISVQLGMSAGTLRVAVHRLRRRYGELLRNEIAQTVETPEQVEDELQHLMAVLREG